MLGGFILVIFFFAEDIEFLVKRRNLMINYTGHLIQNFVFIFYGGGFSCRYKRNSCIVCV